jgi:hypothetical protein
MLAAGEWADAGNMEPIAEPDQEALLAQVNLGAQAPAVTRARVRRASLLSILLATLLGALLSLGIISYINGGRLLFVTPAQFGDLLTRAEGLEAQAGALAQDVEGLQKRLDNLELLTGRLDAVEQATTEMRADLVAAGGEVKQINELLSDLEAQVGDLARQAEDVDARVGTLESQGSRTWVFLEGLAELMRTLFPAEENTQ